MKNTAEGRKTRVSDRLLGMSAEGSGGRQELGPALSGTWQNGFGPGESREEVMPWWNLKRVWSYSYAKDWKRKGSKWNIICAMHEKQWRVSRQTVEWQSGQVLEIRAQAECVCKHGWKLGYSMKLSRSVSGTLCPKLHRDRLFTL